ncbi:hypothetical protein ACIGKQ_14895 [Gordonia sp. NPDC062954]|uniref:hypothetical protein n=1 Tax=Gordonia sp. NPDC062954 TaxID=3364003 RepID=UPI0037C66DCB
MADDIRPDRAETIESVADGRHRPRCGEFLRRTARHRPEALAYLAFGVTAYILFRVSGLDSHITWAHSAAIGYGTAAGLSMMPASMRVPRVRLARVAAVTGAILVPFVTLLTGHHQMQDEIAVVSRSGNLLLTHGIPYVHDATSVTDVNPYLPVMAVFGLPAAVLTRSGLDPQSAWQVVGDPRIWCAAIAIAGIWGSIRLLRVDSRSASHVAVLLIASPTIALEMCASGVDLPLAGLLLFGLAAVATRRPRMGAIAIAAAVAIKWVALLSVPIVIALLVTRFPRAVTLRFAGWFATATAVFGLPAFLSVSDTIAQVLEFPTGRGPIPTPAHSPMPGVLLASFGSAGRNADMILLVACAIILAVCVLRRPPRSFSSAATFAAAGFTCFFLLAPVGRFGYLLVPMMLFGVAFIAQRSAASRQLTTAGATMP